MPLLELLRDARIGFLALIAVALLATVLTAFFTARLFRSIGTLVGAAGAVAEGNLDIRVETRGPLEFQRLSHSFNAMTDSIGQRGDTAFVLIVDSGPGMSTEQVERAFKPYHTTRRNGTGPGLPIARQIALAHGGDLSIRSAVGGGTTVEINRPMGPATVSEQQHLR